jgi:hypothetical protein
MTYREEEREMNCVAIMDLKEVGELILSERQRMHKEVVAF